MPCSWASARPRGQASPRAAAGLRQVFRGSGGSPTGARKAIGAAPVIGQCEGASGACPSSSVRRGHMASKSPAPCRPLPATKFMAAATSWRSRAAGLLEKGLRRTGRRHGVPGARRGQRVLDGVAHRLVHLAAIAKAHLDLGRVHVHVDTRRIDLQVQRIDRLALAVQHVFVGAAHRVREHLVAHEAAVDVEELLVAARARRVGNAGTADHAHHAAQVFDGHALAPRSRRPAHRPAAARARRRRAIARPACRRARPRSRPRAAPAHGGARPRCSAPARWRRS
jgi:hypothetical protein